MVSLSSFPVVVSLLIIYLAAPGAVLVFCAEDFSRHDFPPDFVFGSGTSAYQVYMLSLLARRQTTCLSRSSSRAQCCQNWMHCCVLSFFSLTSVVISLEQKQM